MSLWNYFTSEEQLKFQNHYNALRDQDRVKEILDPEVIINYWNKNADLHFEAAWHEGLGCKLGLIEIEKKKFVVGVKDGKIILFAKLKDFLKIKL